MIPDENTSDDACFQFNFSVAHNLGTTSGFQFYFVATVMTQYSTTLNQRLFSKSSLIYSQTFTKDLQSPHYYDMIAWIGHGS